MGQQRLEMSVVEATPSEECVEWRTKPHSSETAKRNPGQLSAVATNVATRQRRLSDEEFLKALYEMPLDEIPLLSTSQVRSRGQSSLGYQEEINNEINMPLSKHSDSLRASRAIHGLHEGLIKISAEHLIDGRVSDHEKALRVRWFLERDEPYPNWHPFSFETCCRLVGADPDILRAALFSMAREARNYEGKETIPDEEMERMIRNALRISLTLADASIDGQSDNHRAH